MHYPGNHFLSGRPRRHGGDRRPLLQAATGSGSSRGRSSASSTTRSTSDDHACALIKYTIELGHGQRITGEAIGVFHIENGKMVEYWLLERDQKMINDIVDALRQGDSWPGAATRRWR